MAYLNQPAIFVYKIEPRRLKMIGPGLDSFSLEKFASYYFEQSLIPTKILFCVSISPLSEFFSPFSSS
ncbi:hypothetical protein NC653_028980 [Populus alba x Populus x berolinensis]|uniref:Uncharacterized protein n=1 Tax=Populus alba x Populus x berolinensis TaxID=444605 RepID=A0AAD6M107_9ROSI|nr:hypothetical protein NC653_028980 [Populus alba x Populus x berolinensis]